MYSFAPRCREAWLLTSAFADCSGKPGPAAAAKPGAASSSAPSTSIGNGLVMVGHPRRRRLHLVDLRIDRHQQEEREVQDGEDTRENRVQAGGGLQAQPAEHHE